MFELNPRLREDTLYIGHLPLSQVLLSKDANYPWCILVPERPDIREIHHLIDEDRQQLLQESCHLAEVMTALFNPYKMNIAALGNMVPQLHVHHIARYEEDAAWPAPVWGAVAAKSYTDEELEKRVTRLRSALGGDDFRVENISG